MTNKVERKFVRHEKNTSQQNSAASPVTKGLNNKNIEIDVGNVPANRKGKRRPYFDLKLSDIDPIIGSVMASNTVATAVANPTKAGEMPRT